MAWIERQVFILLLWISAAVSLAADIASEDGSVVVATAVLAAMAVWLHGLCRVHRWTVAAVHLKTVCGRNGWANRLLRSCGIDRCRISVSVVRRL